jgi:hypothetical protein
MLKTVKEVILLPPPRINRVCTFQSKRRHLSCCWRRTPQYLQAGTQICIITILSSNCWAIKIIPQRVAWALSDLYFTPTASPCSRFSQFHTQRQSLNSGCSSISMLDTVYWHTLRFALSQYSAVGIATSSGWPRGSEFESRWGQEFSLFHVV